MLSEYLKRDRGPLLRSEEIMEFSRKVEAAREATDRLEERIRQLEAKR